MSESNLHVIGRPPNLGPAFGTSNIFRDRFGGANDQEWLDLLIRSADEQVIDGVQFPGCPDAEFQGWIHGNSGADAIVEAQGFYFFVRGKSYLRGKFGSGSNFLDFGAGWGRISRLFLRDFDLTNMYAYEPNLGYCAVARALNPYICFMNGGYLPDNTLPPNYFDLVVGWSVFSHLPENLVAQWLAEMARVVRPNGYCVFTTWGERFLDRLSQERAALAAGKPVHWYHQQCLQAAGDIDALRARYYKGEFVWFTPQQSEVYGDTFLHPRALRRIIEGNALPFDIVEFDERTLGQDAFILRRRDTEHRFL